MQLQSPAPDRSLLDLQQAFGRVGHMACLGMIDTQAQHLGPQARQFGLRITVGARNVFAQLEGSHCHSHKDADQRRHRVLA